MPLAAEAHPVVEPRPGRIIGGAHVPFAHEGRRIAGLLQVLGEEQCAVGDHAVVVDDAVTEGVETRQDRRAAGRAQRGPHEGVLQVDAVPCHRIHVRRPGELVVQERHRVVPVVVGEDEHHVAWNCSVDLARNHGVGHGRDSGRGRARTGQQECCGSGWHEHHRSEGADSWWRGARLPAVRHTPTSLALPGRRSRVGRT